VTISDGDSIKKKRKKKKKRSRSVNSTVIGVCIGDEGNDDDNSDNSDIESDVGALDATTINDSYASTQKKKTKMKREFIII
jgi:hypothetical protein